MLYRYGLVRCCILEAYLRGNYGKRGGASYIGRTSLYRRRYFIFSRKKEKIYSFSVSFICGFCKHLPFLLYFVLCSVTERFSRSVFFACATWVKRHASCSLHRNLRRTNGRETMFELRKWATWVKRHASFSAKNKRQISKNN